MDKSYDCDGYYDRISPADGFAVAIHLYCGCLPACHRRFVVHSRDANREMWSPLGALRFDTDKL